MFYNHHQGAKPEEDPTSPFVGKIPSGKVRKSEYDDGIFQRVCEALEPPPKQFDGPRRLFPKQKLRKCGEWTDDVIELLKNEGVLMSET